MSNINRKIPITWRSARGGSDGGAGVTDSKSREAHSSSTALVLSIVLSPVVTAEHMCLCWEYWRIPSRSCSRMVEWLNFFFKKQGHDWRAPLSHPSSCMLVNHGPSQQSSKEEYKLWKWGATARYYASHTKTMLPTRKSVPRSSRQLDHTKTSWRS